jgi:hypothetical protein
MKISPLIPLAINGQSIVPWLLGFVVGAAVSIEHLWQEWINLWIVNQSIALFVATVLFFEGCLYFYRAYKNSRAQREIPWGEYVERQAKHWFGWIGFVVIIWGGAIGASNAAQGTPYHAGVQAIANGLGLAFGAWGVRRAVTHWTGSRKRRQKFITDLSNIIQAYQARDIKRAADTEESPAEDS